MLAFRSLFAGLMLAVVAVGGVGAPLVHAAAHAAEWADAQDRHASDGHHDTSDGARLSATCPTPLAPVEADCGVCHGLSAADGGAAETRAGPAETTLVWAAATARTARTVLGAAASRGPPTA